MTFEFCWEHKRCTRTCRVRDLQVLFCWHLSIGEGRVNREDCETCSYRQRWASGELSTADFLKRGERRTRPRPARRVLVVDDEPNILYALEETVRDLGFECIAACDGEEALIIARGVRPDMIITDVIMPRLDGYELCQRLKADKTTRSIPVVMVTVRAGDKDHRKGSAVGADAYLVKPFHLSDLQQVIDELLPPQA
ncbi:MAG TPA: response regulator [Candidatus Methanoperedens sp.]|nr:response regulator [Candidatus Methanoperedens sp.]